MAELVHSLLAQARADDVAVAREAVGLLAQARVGDNRAIAFKLRLAEDERQNGDEEIERRDGDDAARSIGVGGHALQNCGRVVLAAAGIEGKAHIQPAGIKIAGGSEGMRERRGQAGEQREIRRLEADTDNLNRLAVR